MRRLPDIIWFLFIFVLAQCGNDPGKNPVDNGNTGGNNPSPAETLLSTDQYNTLISAQNLYDRLAGKMSTSTARKALVDSLGTWSGLSEVRLWEDGVTVSMKLPGGMYCCVETGEPDTFSGSTAAFPLPGASANRPAALPDNSILSKTAGTVASPDSVPVLFLVLATDIGGISKHVSDTRKIFIDAGWDPSNITIRQPASLFDYAALNPNTLISGMQSYGIIFLYAHGKYGRPSTNLLPQHFIQYCFTANYPDYDEKKLIAWDWEGKVIVGKNYVFIRQDLLTELMSLFPKSVVVMNTCWGYYLRESFLKRGVSALFSWDHVVMSDDAFASSARIARRMSSDSPAPSDMDLYTDPLLVKTSRNTLHETAEMHLDHTFDAVYFPAWAEFSMDTSVLKFPVSGVRIAASSGYTPERKELFDRSGKGLIWGLTPGKNRFTVEALDLAGAPGMTLTITRDLKAGKNNVDIDFSVQIVNVQVVKYTYEDHMGGYGPYTTDFIRYSKWNRNPKGTGYSVITHIGDYTSSPQTVYERDAIDMKKLSETAFRKEQIIQQFGSDIIGMGDGEVVMIQYGSHYGHHRGENTISDWLKDNEAREKNNVKSHWHEVYFF
jgi:hypothetical protein